MTAYYVGLMKAGNTLIVELARSVDQLNCELWRYLGKRETSPQKIKENTPQFLAAINADESTAFTRVRVRVIGRADYSAGHHSTLPAEMHEAERA